MISPNDNALVAHLSHHAANLRNGLEGCRRAAEKMVLLKQMRHFPNGCCGISAKFMAHHLRTQGVRDEGEMSLAAWRMRGRASHAWLEVSGMIVDVTADQFDQRLPRVIVTRDRTWHSQFRGDRAFAWPDFMVFEENWRAEFLALYDIACDH